MGDLLSAVIHAINRAGAMHWDFASAMFVQVAVLVAILALVEVCLRRRVRAVVRYWLWALVILKLMLPVALRTPASLAYWVRSEPQPAATIAFPAADMSSALGRWELRRISRGSRSRKWRKGRSPTIRQSLPHRNELRSLRLAPTRRPQPSSCRMPCPTSTHTVRSSLPGAAVVLYSAELYFDVRPRCAGLWRRQERRRGNSGRRSRSRARSFNFRAAGFA